MLFKTKLSAIWPTLLCRHFNHRVAGFVSGQTLAGFSVHWLVIAGHLVTPSSMHVQCIIKLIEVSSSVLCTPQALINKISYSEHLELWFSYLGMIWPFWLEFRFFSQARIDHSWNWNKSGEILRAYVHGSMQLFSKSCYISDLYQYSMHNYH